MNNFNLKKYLTEGNLKTESNNTPYRLETDDIYKTPSGKLIIITIGKDISNQIQYIILDPESAEVDIEEQPYEKIKKNNTWTIISEK